MLATAELSVQRYDLRTFTGCRFTAKRFAAVGTGSPLSFLQPALQGTPCQARQA